MASKFQPPPDAPDTKVAMSDEDSGRLLDQTRRALFASNPALASNDLFKGEFDDAFSEFVKQGVDSGTSYEEAWKNTVAPVIDKWQTVPQMPQTAKWQPNDVEKYKENLILAREASTSAAKSTDEDVKKSLTGIVTNARKVIDDIEAKYPTRSKFQSTADIPELPQGVSPSSLGFGSKYRVGNRVFQNFSPSPPSPGAKIQIGGSLAQPSPVAPGAPVDDGSAPPMMPPPSPRFDPSNIAPQPGQSPATAGMVNVPGSGMFSAPPAPTAPAPAQNIDPSTVLTGENLPTPAAKPRRVRVTGPKGEKGTIEAGDKLPEGWKLVE